MKKKFAGSPKGSPSIKGLIEKIRNSADPAEIDAALLSCSPNPPFYPDNKELLDFLIAAKSDPALDAKLLAAAKISAPLREEVLLWTRIAKVRQGAFTNFIHVDAQDPLNSRIFKVVRAGQIGSGNGAWGGLKEGEDLDVSVTVNREVYEEVIDAVRLLLNVAGGAEARELEKKFDVAMKKATQQKRPLSSGVADFVAGLGGNAGLQAQVQSFTDLANGLIDDLVAVGKQKLFQCRDDAHAIDRGWGFKIDAFAHVASISKETADKFETLRQNIEALKAAAARQGLGTVAGEMQGIAVYTLAEAPEEVKKNHYGHEGLAEIVGFARLTKTDAWESFAKSGAVDILAAKMRLTPGQLRKVYDSLRAGGSETGHLPITADEYRKARSRLPGKKPPPQKL